MYCAKKLQNNLKMKRLKISDRKGLFLFLIMITITSCATIKPKDKSYINDGEMSLSIRKVEKSEVSFQLYREGAAGATGGKSSGGCGCN
jgi:hypothetical protein